MDEVAEPTPDGPLPVSPTREARAGWEEAFRRMAAEGDDELLDPEALTETEWERAEWGGDLPHQPKRAEEWVAAFSGKLGDMFGDHDDNMRYLDAERRTWEPK